jgi:hypothetical protein
MCALCYVIYGETRCCRVDVIVTLTIGKMLSTYEIENSDGNNDNLDDGGLKL